MTLYYAGEDVAPQDATAEETLPPSYADTATTGVSDDLVADLTDALRIQMEDMESRIAKRLDGQQRQLDYRLTPLEQASAMTKRQMETLLQRSLTPEDFQDVKTTLEAQQVHEAEREELARYREWAKTLPPAPSKEELIKQQYPIYLASIERDALRQGLTQADVEANLSMKHPTGRDWRDWNEFVNYHLAINDSIADAQYRDATPAPEPSTTLGSGAIVSEQEWIDRYAAGAQGGIEPTPENSKRARELMNRAINPVRPRPLSQVRR